MKFLALIQARCGSSRLPNKVMMDLSGKTVIERVVERVNRSKYVDETIVVTSIGKENLGLIKLCVSGGTRVFVGSENDVLDRFYQAAKLIVPEYVIRITADCPVLDPGILDRAIESLKPETDYLTDLNCTLADGLSIEIIKFSALKRAWKEADLASEREHVTMYFKNRRDLFSVQNFVSPFGDIGHMRWTVDYENDYELIKTLYQYFADKKKYFDTQDILEALKKHPDWIKINSNNVRHEGLMKSLKNDKKI
jgi:spore coat polysaccharide biosynthesis protein SpsF (cytidylyltransferase family)